jgi:hypothetical protein
VRGNHQVKFGGQLARMSMHMDVEAPHKGRWSFPADRVSSLLAGGRRDGALVEPTVLAHVPDGVRLDREEVYGPSVESFTMTAPTSN